MRQKLLMDQNFIKTCFNNCIIITQRTRGNVLQVSGVTVFSGGSKRAQQQDLTDVRRRRRRKWGGTEDYKHLSPTLQLHSACPSAAGAVVSLSGLLSRFFTCFYVTRTRSPHRPVSGMSSAGSDAPMSRLERSNHTSFIDDNILYVWGGYQVGNSPVQVAATSRCERACVLKCPLLLNHLLLHPNINMLTYTWVDVHTPPPPRLVSVSVSVKVHCKVFLLSKFSLYCLCDEKIK